MKVLDPGHRYSVVSVPEFPGGDRNDQIIQFRKTLPGGGRVGTNCQELLRVLIDRVKFLDNELPHQVNADILLKLREALVLFEARALERKVTTGKLEPEHVLTDGSDGHFCLQDREKEDDE